MESNAQNNTVAAFNPLLDTPSELVDQSDGLDQALLKAYSEASPVVQIKVIANILKSIRPDLRKEDLNQLKALYCKNLIGTDDAELSLQDRTFKIGLKVNARPFNTPTDEQWTIIYGQVDQRFREILSDYKPIRAFS